MLPSAMASEPLVSSLAITDVTPTSFSVVWISSEPSTCNISLYDSQLHPLPDPPVVSESALHPPAEDLGVMKARVTGLHPDTLYYFQTVTTSKLTGLVTIYPADPERVETELSTSVVFNDMLAHRILQTDGTTPAKGALLIAEVESASYPITGWVDLGDFTPWAFINLDNIHSQSSHSNLDLVGGEGVTLTSIGGALGFKRIIGTIPPENYGIQTLKPEPTDEQCTLSQSFPDSLFVDFGVLGLYIYSGTNWNKINSNSPAALGAYGSKMVANLPGLGLYEYDGTHWQRISTNDTAESIAAVGSTLYVDFGVAGLYTYDGSSWNRIVRMDASSLATFDNKLAVNFPGRGLYVYDGGWSQITKNDTAQAMIGLGSMLYVEFADGLWEYNGASFTLLTNWDVSSLGTFDGKLAVNFPGHGLYEYDGSWRRLTANDTAEHLAGVSNILYVDFGATGLYAYNGTNFKRIRTDNPEDMVAAHLPWSFPLIQRH